VTVSARSVLAAGASAGGVEALQALVGGLPAGLPAAVALVLHIPPTSRSRLPEILARAGPLPAAHAEDGEPLVEGRIYVAPPDRHLVLRGRRCVLTRCPRENQARPAIDPLFRSAAIEFGQHAVAVVLSGARADGVAGAAAVSAAGGTVFVQDPAEAVFSSMPAQTIAGDHLDRVLPLAEIAPSVTRMLVHLSLEADVSKNDNDDMSVETRYALLDRETIERAQPPGTPSAFSCPAFGGVLWADFLLERDVRSE